MQIKNKLIQIQKQMVNNGLKRSKAFNSFSNPSNGKVNFSKGFTNGLNTFPSHFNAFLTGS